ncbi:hypothetical protein ENUP19_0267G0009 [Entamoeba nuttalli]|uniref:E3 ubiquitin-protein ligase n=2 Tax=Entamoeba nuttalli TaxID=412467 RepID=K2H4J6_ENTNP|nr:zinc finger in N-recognin protein [Entamoeba nuttalli P19]EKE41227.1 zinc finger in N-recognin protein [Entamoeba nuttalli P19]|eukprot:XP_008856438.1 zinc finger in N-recognin protein [Entamoeba nuttalli P19]
MSNSLSDNIILILSGEYPSSLPSQVILEIFENIPFEKVKEQCAPLVHSYCCRHAWGNDSKAFLYRCKTCETGPNSCICVECFQNGNHEGHEYYMQKSGSGGTCDCGSSISWKASGFCKYHGHHFEGNLYEITPEPWKSRFDEKMELLLTLLVEKLQIIFEKFHQGETIQQLEQYGILSIIKILRKCCEIDLFQFHVTELMKTNKQNYYCRMTLLDKNRKIGIDEFLIDMCMIDCEVFVDELSLFVMELLTDDKNTDRLYESFMDDLIYIMNNESPSNCMNDVFTKLTCQFTSCKQFNEKYFFGNVARSVSFIGVISKYFRQDAPTISLDSPKITSMNYYTTELLTIVTSNPSKLFSIPMLYQEYIRCLESIMFYHEELRELHQHVQYENLCDYSPFYCKEVLLGIGFTCLKSLSKEQLLNVIQDVTKRYLKIYNMHVKCSHPDVGINQPISMYYPLLTFLVYAISLTDSPFEMFQTLPSPNLLLTYPIIFHQFLTELSYDQLWARNGQSVMLKTICCLPQYPEQLMSDTFLLQLASYKTEELLQLMIPLCKIDRIDEVIAKQKEISNECPKSVPSEIVAGSISLLKIINNMFSDPMLSNKLSQKQEIIYLFIHCLASRQTNASDIKKSIPSNVDGLRDMDIEEIFSEIVDIKQKKCYLKEEYWKYINPYCPYINSVNREVVCEEYSKKMNKSLPCIYQIEKRDPTLESCLLHLLHSPIVSDLCCKLIIGCHECKVVSLVEHLLRLRAAYHEGITYDNYHKNILTNLGEILANHREWKDASTIKLCKGTLLEDVFKGYESINGKEVKQSNDSKSKKLALLKKMAQKRDNFQKVSIVDIEKEEVEEDTKKEGCIICRSCEDSENDPLGFLGHIEATDAIRSAEYAESVEGVRGETKEECWKKPLGLIEGEWKWKPKRNNNWDVTKDDQEYRVLSSCPHKIHLECYLKDYEDSGNEENYYLSKSVYCPLCHTISNVFIEEHQPNSIKLEDPSFEGIDNVINQCINSIPESVSSFNKSVNHTLSRTLTATVRFGIQNPVECSFLSMTSVVASTVMSLEIQMRSSRPTRYEHQLNTLYSYLQVIKKIAANLSIQFRKDVLEQICTFTSARSPILQLLRCYILFPEHWSTFLALADMHELLAIYSEIQQFSKFTPPVNCNTIVKESELPQYSKYSTEDQLVDALAQTYLRRIAILKDVLTVSPEPLKTHYDFPIHETLKVLNEKNCQCVGYIQRPTIPQPFKFISLPSTYQQLINEVLKTRCCVCGIEASKIIYNCAICMTCGCLLCYKDKKHQDIIHSERPVYEHMIKCSGEVGIFLVVHSAILIIMTPRMHAQINGIYVDRFGESPDSSYLTKEMYGLNTQLLEKIERFYLTGEVSSSPELNFYVPKFH